MTPFNDQYGKSLGILKAHAMDRQAGEEEHLYRPFVQGECKQTLTAVMEFLEKKTSNGLRKSLQEDNIKRSVLQGELKVIRKFSSWPLACKDNGPSI